MVNRTRFSGYGLLEPPMEPEKRRLLESIDRDRELLITFLQEFIRCPTPNPPGDTRIAAGHVQKLLDTHGVAYRVIAPNVIMPNIVANFSTGKPGRHLAINGHIDVFPVGSTEGWTHDPWGGRPCRWQDLRPRCLR